MEDLTQIDNEPTGHFIRIVDYLLVLNSHSPCVISEITHNHCLVFVVTNVFFCVLIFMYDNIMNTINNIK